MENNNLNSVFETKKAYKCQKERFKQSQNTKDFDLSRQVIHNCKKALDDIKEKYEDNYKQNEYYQKYSELMWLTEQYIQTNNEGIYFQKTTSENIMPQNLKHLYPSCKNFFSAVNKLSNYIDLEDLDIFQKSLLWKTDKTYQANEKKENPINRTVPLIGTYHGQLKNWVEPDELKPFPEILKDYQTHFYNWFSLQLNDRKNKGINIEAPEYNFIQEHLEHQQPENDNADEVTIKHPKHDPNYWNTDCFELFKYLYDEYYKGTKRQITNIWFYLKEYNNQKYILSITKDSYKDFIDKNYKIVITNFDKARQKWEDKEYKKLDEHRRNFEDGLK